MSAAVSLDVGRVGRAELIERLGALASEVERLSIANAQLVDNHGHAIANLTATQERCTELLHGLRAMLRADDALLQVLGAVAHERRRQDEKFGPIDDAKLAIPDGTGGPMAQRECEYTRDDCDDAFAEGKGTWRHVLEEEVSEAAATETAADLREELLQVAAVAVKWVQIIDARAARDARHA